MLLDDRRQIDLEEFVLGLAGTAGEVIADESVFPMDLSLSSSNETTRLLAARAKQYAELVRPLAEALVVAGAWGLRQHDGIWTRAIERILNARNERSGKTVLLDMQRLPILPPLYAGGVAAVHRGNYDVLRALAVDPQLRDIDGSRPLMGRAHPGAMFSDARLVPQLLALEATGQTVDDQRLNRLQSGQEGNRYTPMSEYLFETVKPMLNTIISDENDYADTFDRFEALLTAVVIDARTDRPKGSAYINGPWYGRFTWRGRHSEMPIERLLLNDLEDQKQDWPPLRARLFGGSYERAHQALQAATEGAQSVRAQQR